jgi:hypothetical protein
MFGISRFAQTPFAAVPRLGGVIFVDSIIENVGVLDSTGNLTVIGNVTAFGTI